MQLENLEVMPPSMLDFHKSNVANLSFSVDIIR